MIPRMSITDIIVDLVKEGLGEIRSGNTLSEGFKKRQNIQPGEYVITRMSYKVGDTHAKIDVDIIPAIEKEEPIVKYYKLERGFVQTANGHSICNLNRGSKVELISRDEETITVKMDNIQVTIGLYGETFESWLSPVEDKPITAEDYLNSVTGQKGYGAYSEDQIVQAFNDGGKNQWVNHARLRELAEKWVNTYNGTFPKEGLIVKFRDALQNIKQTEDK